MEYTLVVTFLSILWSVESEKHKNNVCATLGDYYNIDESPNCWYNPDVDAELPEMVARNGYPLETNEVVTEDGYVLALFRIPPKNKTNRVVLLSHPLSAHSGVWVDKGRNGSLAFTLSDAGYDVWMGNFRGNKNSMRHVSLNAREKRYWNFSFHEIALFDMPALLKFVTNETGVGSVSLVGHSMGSLSALVYASLRPEESRRLVKVFIATTMGVYFEHFRWPIRYFAKEVDYLLKKLYDAGWYSVIRDASAVALTKLFCTHHAPQQHFCFMLYLLAAGYNADEVEPSWLPIALTQNPGGASIKTFRHVVQLIGARHRFQHFDYGAALNRYYYNSPLPPVYPLWNIKTPFYMMYGSLDQTLTPEDTLSLYNELPAEAKIYGTRRLNYGHNDFVFAKNAKAKVYDHIVEFLDEKVYGAGAG